MRQRKSTLRRVRTNAACFRFLGLQRGECDLAVIRSAAGALSGSIPDCEGQHGIEGVMHRRVEIAVATYRLLDPRRRKSFLERVQLCYAVERPQRSDLDYGSSGIAAGGNPWNVPAPLMKRPVIERAIQEEAADPVAAQAMADTMSWLEERREVIRMLRDSEPSAKPLVSLPLSWIRSVLGW